MSLLDSNDARPIHFVGIAGAGMSALAELFLRRGVHVTGCDANPAGADDLRRLDVVVEPHDPAHVDHARALVVTSAMPKDHPELLRARERGIPVIRRAEALGEVTAERELVGVAGTHGKTTTTVMTATALAAAGRDPTALVGGRVAAWEGNLRPGGDRLYVVEADEYDRSFLALTPTVAVAILLAGCRSDGADRPADVLRDDAITVASFDFPESRALAEIYAQALEGQGLRVVREPALGPRELVEPALERGLVELVPEYAGSALAFLGGSPTSDTDLTHQLLLDALGPRGLTALDPAPAQDRNAFAASGLNRFGLRYPGRKPSMPGGTT
jgi:hypothetical protein